MVAFSFAAGGGVSIAGVLSTNADSDQYTVHLVAGQVYDFWAAGDQNDAGGLINNPVIELSGGPGPIAPIVDDDSAEGNDANILYTPTVTGDYTLTVREFTSSGTGGLFTLNITNRSFDDDIADHTFATNATPPVSITGVGTNTALEVGDTLTSSIANRDQIGGNGGDRDTIAVFLEGNGDESTGTTYTFDARGSDTSGLTLPVPFLRLLDADGLQIATNSGGVGNNAQIATFDPDDSHGSGWYFVEVSGDENSSGTYEVQVTASAGSFDVPGDITSPYNVPLNGSIQGTVDTAGDSDWYAITLVAGAHYQFNLDSITLNDPELTLRDSAGAVVLTDDDGGTGANALIDFTAVTGGLYFLDAHNTDEGTGTYQLAATLVSAEPAPIHVVTTDEGASVIGSDHTDSLIGTDAADSMFGAGGNDTVFGGLGEDNLRGGDGSDTVDGGGDSDTINDSDGADSLIGNTGDDLFFLFQEGSTDTVHGNDGNDTILGGVVLQGSDNNFVGAPDLLSGDANDDVIVSENSGDSLLGGDGNDTLNGAGAAGTNSMDGGTGNDSILGTDFNDTVQGGDGNDTIDGGDGTNLLNGGIGNDTFNNVDTGDQVTAGAGVDQVNALIGWTLDTDEENLTLIGGFNSLGNGNGGANIIFGNSGNNTLQGLGANDIVSGGAGNDTLIGGAGKDLNTGGAGLDHIKYNALSESGTTFATRDAINTFAHGDKIDLSAIDANSNVAGNQAFTFSSAQALTGLSGLLIAQQVATNAFLVLADINGDHVADFSLNVYTSPGFGTFHSFDFIL